MKDFIFNYCSDASMSIIHTWTTQICSQARQNIWKQNPQLVFTLNGKQLKSKPNAPTVISYFPLASQAASSFQSMTSTPAMPTMRLESAFNDDSSSGISTGAPSDDDDHGLDVKIQFER